MPKKKKYLFFSLTIFLIFFGFYIMLMVISSMGLKSISKSFSIPIRIIIGFCLCAIFFLSKKRKGPSHYVLFGIFSLLYFYRIVADFYQSYNYGFSTSELIFYFGSFAVLPYCILASIKLDERHFQVGHKALILSAFLFSILAFVSYKKYVGVYSRLSIISGDEDLLSPLILSYCASLAIGIAATYLRQHRLKAKQKIYSLSIICFSIVPFFLGASRGSIFALFIPFIFMVWAKKNFMFNFKVLLILIFSIGVLVYLDGVLSSGLLKRFSGISEDIESGGQSSGAERILMWKQSFAQFMDHPIFGDRFKISGFDSYNHNLFLEVLQTTGAAGFIPFLYLIILALKGSLRIFKAVPMNSWIGVIFIQSFIQNMFSGAVFTASWFWASMALVFSTQYYIKKRNISRMDKGGSLSQFKQGDLKVHFPN